MLSGEDSLHGLLFTLSHYAMLLVHHASMVIETEPEHSIYYTCRVQAVEAFPKRCNG